MNISIKKNPIVISLLLIITIFVLIHIFIQIGVFAFGWNPESYLIEKLSLTEEKSLPTLYSSFLFLFSAYLLAFIAYIKKSSDDGVFFLYWLFLAFVFVFLAIDELFVIHEKLNEIVQFDGEKYPFLAFGWVVPYGLLVIILLVFSLRFIVHLPKNIRVLIFVAGAVFVGSALGMELLGAQIYEMQGRNTIAYSFITTVEETFEMIGILLFVYALFNYIYHECEGQPILIQFS